MPFITIGMPLSHNISPTCPCSGTLSVALREIDPNTRDAATNPRIRCFVKDKNDGICLAPPGRCARKSA